MSKLAGTDAMIELDRTRSKFHAAGAAILAALLLLTVGLAGCERHNTDVRIPRLTRDTLDQAKGLFNAGTEGPRLIVFFSSGCASCDTGSAALQSMLDTVAGPVTVFAVWEPVKESDPPPTSHMLGNLKDKRVHQIWDPDHIMSDEMRAAERAHPGSPPQARTRTSSLDTGIMYDTAALFGPGARWAATLPAADYLEVGLAAILDELHKRLDAMGKHGAEDPR